MKKKLLAWWKNIVSVCIGALAATAFEGIIGNRADTLFTLVWPSIEELVVMKLLSWYVVVPVLLGSIVICVHFIRQSRILEHARAIDNKMLKVDDLLLLGLASCSPSLSAEEEKKRIITDVLLGAIAEFDGQVQRAALLLPDASQEYLYCWANYQMPQESIDSMNFYIGPDQSRRRRESGVAGEVFLTGELQVGHLRRANGGTWICEDCPNYMQFSGRRPFPPYSSFVNIPLIGTDSTGLNSSRTSCLGVVCFDSTNKSVFDNEACQTVLRTLARRITEALLILKRDENLPSPSNPSNSNP